MYFAVSIHDFQMHFYEDLTVQNVLYLITSLWQYLVDVIHEIVVSS